MTHRVLMAFAVLTLAPPALASTLKVGPGQAFASPCAAIAAASAGDTVEVAAGSYDGDTCSWATDNLTIRGTGGMAKIDDTGVAVNGDKGIFVVYAPNVTIENFELAGATSTSSNGAGIRHQGMNLTVRGCYLHDNQDGILGGPLDASGNTVTGQGSVVILNSEFSHNGAGDGQSHNMYLGKYATFTLEFSYSHDANVGHLVKSRAYESFIAYNRLTDETGGMASYEIDLPVAGTAYVIGNIIEQSPTGQNDNIITYGEEPQNVINPDTHLFIVNNTFLNDYAKGTFVHLHPAITTPAVVENNIFEGGGTDCDQAGAMLRTNFDAPASGDPMFVNQATYDVRLQAGSPCIDKGTAPGASGAQPLAPGFEYVHPENGEPRVVVGAAIDVGAYEFDNPDGGLGDSGVVSMGEADAATVSTDAGAPSRDASAGKADSGAKSSSDAGRRGSLDAGKDASHAGMSADGSSAASTGSGGGCGCVAAGTTTPSNGSWGWLGLPVALAAWARRRGSKRAGRFACDEGLLN